MTTQPDADTVKPCCKNGLVFPDGRHTCWRHATEEDRRLLRALDRRAAARGLATDPASTMLPPLSRIWPYGPNLYVQARQAMLDWAEQHDLRLSTRGSRCLHWLRAGRCGLRGCERLAVGDWVDHVTAWVHNGQAAVLVSQPYDLSAQARAELAELGTESFLRVEIRAAGWYGHDTMFIGIWRADVPTGDDKRAKAANR